MAWNNQGGPWGGGKSPWGRGTGSSGGGGGNRPPDFEEMLRRGQDRMKNVLPGGFGSWRGLGLIVLVLIALWGATGFYVVNPGEVGVNTVFGQFKTQTEPGLHWNPPAPIGKVYTPDVSTLNSTYIGLRGGGDTRADIPEESLMLTRDENIIEIKAVVLWRVRVDQVQQYLFEIDNPEASVKSTVESALREVIGQSQFQNAITVQKAEIASETQQLAQKMLETYHAGIQLVQVNLNEVTAPQEVIEAFRDVQRASNDAQSSVNDAYAYRNKVVQQAQGMAVQMVREAEAYKSEKVANAKGDADRFLSVYEQYKQNPEVTERRLYLESMQSIFGSMNKVLIEQSAGGSGAIPYLPLDQLLKRQPNNVPNNQSMAPAGSDTSVQSTPSTGASQ